MDFFKKKDKIEIDLHEQMQQQLNALMQEDEEQGNIEVNNPEYGKMKKNMFSTIGGTSSFKEIVDYGNKTFSQSIEKSQGLINEQYLKSLIMSAVRQVMNEIENNKKNG